MNHFIKKVGACVIVACMVAFGVHAANMSETALENYWHPEGKYDGKVTVFNMTPYPLYATAVRTKDGRLDLPRNASGIYSNSSDANSKDLVIVIQPGQAFTLAKPVNPWSQRSPYDRDLWVSVNPAQQVSTLQRGMKPTDVFSAAINLGSFISKVYVGLSEGVADKFATLLQDSSQMVGIGRLGSAMKGMPLIKIYTSSSSALAQLKKIGIANPNALSNFALEESAEAFSLSGFKRNHDNFKVPVVNIINNAHEKFLQYLRTQK